MNLVYKLILDAVISLNEFQNIMLAPLITKEWHMAKTINSIKSQKPYSANLKDRPSDANGRKIKKIKLAIYGIPLWLPLPSPLHIFAFPMVITFFYLPCYIKVLLIGLHIVCKAQVSVTSIN